MAQGRVLLVLVAALLARGAAAARPLQQPILLPGEVQGHSRREEEKQNLRPMIGIVSQAGDPAPKGHSYIAASYVKFIESAGARAVPILCDMSKDEVRRRFKAVNGVLVPGGSQDLRPGQPFYDTVAQLFDLAVEANDNGDYFPLHGTCLGFETLAVVASANHSILSDFDSEDLPSPLFLTDQAEGSRFFNYLPKQVVEHLQVKPYAMENHAHGLAWTAVAENPKLSSFFDVLSLSADRKGGVYVSTMEAHRYPFTATQWHPEKNAFEWTPEKHIPHDPDAIEVTQEVANFVVGEARNNFHLPASQDEEEDMLMYNWAPSYTGKHHFEGEEVDFEQSYFFPPAHDYLHQQQAARQQRQQQQQRAGGAEGTDDSSTSSSSSA